MGQAVGRPRAKARKVTVVPCAEEDDDLRASTMSISLFAPSMRGSMLAESVASLGALGKRVKKSLFGTYSARVEEQDLEDMRRLRSAMRGRFNIGLSDFEVRQTVGKGSFGRVRLCVPKEHLFGPETSYLQYTPIALKIMNKVGLAQSMNGLAQAAGALQREVKILSSVEHPYILNLLVVFHDERRVLVVYEFVNGGELAHRLDKAGGALPEREIALFAADLVLIFDYLQERGIVYRDLKPENLLLGRNGHLKLIDFGFAKDLAEGPTRTFCGTLAYQAPEVLLRKPYDTVVDWWAVGCVVYEMCVGKGPFSRWPDDFTTQQAILANNVVWPAMSKPGKELVKTCLVNKPERRAGSAKHPVSKVKRARLFKDVDWQKHLNGSPYGKFEPETISPTDTSNFPDYPESMEDGTVALSQKDNKHWEATIAELCEDW